MLDRSAHTVMPNRRWIPLVLAFVSGAFAAHHLWFLWIPAAMAARFYQEEFR